MWLIFCWLFILHWPPRVSIENNFCCNRGYIAMFNIAKKLRKKNTTDTTTIAVAKALKPSLFVQIATAI